VGLRGKRPHVCVGTPDPSLTVVGMAAISELSDQLGVIKALDAAVGFDQAV
jgi:hypothetical protein